MLLNINNFNEISNNLEKMFVKKFEEVWIDIKNNLNIPTDQLELGHRLRPRICFYGYLANFDKIDPNNIDFIGISKIACSIELIHKASLFIDDWIDKDDFRHNKKTLHKEFSPEYANLVSIKMILFALNNLRNNINKDFIFSHTYNICLNNIIEILYDMIDGTLQEISLGNKEIFEYEKILEITNKQTTKIIQNSLLLGYCFGANNKNLDQNIISLFEEIGKNCGYIFQIMNDLEVFANPNKLKKHKGKFNFDITEHKKNLVIAKLYKMATEDEKLILEKKETDYIKKLLKKYELINIIQYECEIVFNNMLDEINSKNEINIYSDWKKIFISFLERVKFFAKQRIQ